MSWIIVGHMGYCAVAMHMFGLWFCWFVDFSLVHCVAVLNVFVGAEACCLVVGQQQQDFCRIFSRNC
jgi:hypothetical protein